MTTTKQEPKKVTQEGTVPKAPKAPKQIPGVQAISRDGTGKVVVIVRDGGQCLTDPTEIQKFLDDHKE